MEGRTTIVIAHRPGTIAPRRHRRAARRRAGRRRSARTTSCWPRTSATASVLAALGRGRRRPRPTRCRRRDAEEVQLTMWAGGALSDEDRLDRAETGRVLRRSLQFAQPYRRTIWSASASSVRPRCAPSPVRCSCKFGLDHGIGDGSSASALNIAVVALRRRRRSSATSSAALQYLAINRAGEGFLRDLRVTRVRPAAGAVDGVLRPQQGRRARQPDDRRHREHGRADPVGPAAVRRRRPARGDDAPADDRR